MEKTNYYLTKSAFIIVMLLLPFIGNAQYEQDIISIGDRKLTIREAYKIKDIPSFKDTIVQIDKLDYSVIPKVVPTTYELKGIKAAKVKVQSPLKRLYRGYVKGGVGTYTTPLLSFHLNSLRSRDWAYGMNVHHFSSNGGINDYAHSGYSENEFGGWGKKSLKKHTLSFGANYEADKVHYYGFKPQDLADEMEIESLEIDKKDIRHRLGTINFNTGLKSYYTDSTKINHDFTIAYRASSDNFDSRERNFLLSGNVNTYKGKFKFILGTRLDANAYRSKRVIPFDFLNQEYDRTDILTNRDNNTIFELAPQINAVVGDLRANIGLGIAFDIDNTTAVRIFPRGYAKYNLFSDLFTVYAGLEGSLDRNSYYSLFNDNPFIQNEIELTNTFNKAEFYAGIRGTISKDLSFNAKVSTRNFSDMPLFVNTNEGDTLSIVENRFDVIYDQGTSSQVVGELTYQQSKKLKVFSRLELNTYNLDREEEAWHTPGRKISLGASYNLLDKFIISADLYSEGKRYAQTLETIDGVNADDDGISIRTLKGFVDSNLKLEYRYTKRVSAFLQINNITGGKYKRWNNYPVQQLMLLGGLSYSF
ncbi:MAG: hypothetical protein ACI81Y_002784 [Glaciecola sp.]|jgi:hypothetical protein